MIAKYVIMIDFYGKQNKQAFSLSAGKYILVL